MKVSFLVFFAFVASTSCFGQKTTVYKLLQGKWQSMDDKTDLLWFDKNHQKGISAGINKWDDELFVLSNSCENSSDKDRGLPKEKDKYISATDSDMCWYIVELTPTRLVLSYMGRGNTLSYRRVTNKKAR